MTNSAERLEAPSDGADRARAVAIGAGVTLAGGIVTGFLMGMVLFPVLFRSGLSFQVIGPVLAVLGVVLSVPAALVGGFTGGAVFARRRAVRDPGSLALVGCLVGGVAWIASSLPDVVVRVQNDLPVVTSVDGVSLVVTLVAATVGGLLIPTAVRGRAV